MLDKKRTLGEINEDQVVVVVLQKPPEILQNYQTAAKKKPAVVKEPPKGTQSISAFFRKSTITKSS